MITVAKTTLKSTCTICAEPGGQLSTEVLTGFRADRTLGF
jgi:hypothetical protein